jgi:catechol 2,3-dioxygenase-like lactoylglutathione lyase family enzyme
MPVSHIGLTVSHLPRSTSFFLSALQPLGYRYIGDSGGQVGFGIRDADFFLCQETPGYASRVIVRTSQLTADSMRAGAAHIAFTAADRTTVRDFYTAALKAGGRPNGAPSSRCDGDGHFNAAVLDLDGNSIEVVFRNGPDVRDDGTVVEHSRVITWQRSVYESYRGDRSVVSSRTSTSKPALTEVMSEAPSVASKAPSVVPVSAPAAVPQAGLNAGDGAAKTIIGTLLGAAAGAAVAYAMVRSEQDSAKKESNFSAFAQAKNTVKAAVGLAQASSQPMQDPQPVEPELAHRNIDAQSHYSAAPSQARSVYAPRQIEAATSSYYSSSEVSAPRSQARAPKAIEAATSSYYSPSEVSLPRTKVNAPKAIEAATPSYYSASEVSVPRAKVNAPKAIEAPTPSYYSPSQVSVSPTRKSSHRTLEYAPAHSVAPSEARSRHTVARSVTSPEMLTIEKARSVASSVKSQTIVSASTVKPPASRAQSVAHSVAPSSLISSFVPDHVSRRVSEGSVHSHHTSRSKARSSHSHASRHTLHSRHSRSHNQEPVESSPSPPPIHSKAPSQAPSKAASLVNSILGRDAKSTASSDFIDDLEIEELTEDDLDTVVPSDSISNAGFSSRRSHKKHSEGSVASKHSSHSKHSHRSHRSHKSSHDSDDDKASQHSSESKKSRRSHRSNVISEPSDASTVRPIKSSSRKDSVTQGQYDGLFDEVRYGSGSVASKKLRGITPSMVSAAGKNANRSMISFNMAQKARVFEGQT